MVSQKARLNYTQTKFSSIRQERSNKVCLYDIRVKSILAVVDGEIGSRCEVTECLVESKTTRSFLGKCEF